MPNIKKINTVQPHTRLVTGFKTAVMLAPLAFSGALAQETDVAAQMSTKANAGIGTIGTGIATVLVALLVIALGFTAYGIFKKPKG